MPKLNFDEMRANGYPDWTDDELAYGYYNKYMKDQGWTWEEFRAASGVEDGGGIGGEGDYPSQEEPGSDVEGFGYETPEIAAEMGAMDLKPWLDEVSNAISGKVASGATFGVAPAIARRATMDEKTGVASSDVALQRGTDILGKNLSFLLEGASGIPTSIAATPIMPSKFLKFGTEAFNPGVLPAIKRVAGNAIDATLIEMNNKLIGGEVGVDEIINPGTVAGELWDTAKSAGTWGGALETLLGMKRLAGSKWATRGMSPGQKALDDAIAAVQDAIKRTGATAKPGMETISDLLGTRGPAITNSLADVAPNEYAISQQFHQDRLSKAPGRIRTRTEAMTGKPSLDTPEVQAQKYLEQGKYQENLKFRPLFDKTPKITKESVWVNTTPKKTKLTAPAGMGRFMKDPDVADAWKAANEKGKKLAKSYAIEDGRDPASVGELEEFWHTVREMADDPDKTISNYGKRFKEILRANYQDLDKIVATEAAAHQQSRAAILGQKVAKGKSHLLETEGRTITDPADRNAMVEGYFGELARAADEGDPIPRSSTELQQTIGKVLGPTRSADADEFNRFLAQERTKVEADRAVANRKPGTLPLDEPPKSRLKKAASGVARVGIGAALGGLPQAIWGIPYLLNKMHINPNKLMSQEKGEGIMRILREQIANMPQQRPKNWAEGKGNMGGVLPFTSADVQDVNQERRKERRKGAERSEKYLKGED